MPSSKPRAAVFDLETKPVRVRAAHALNHCAGPRLGDTAYLTLFSTSVCSERGGDRDVLESAIDLDVVAQTLAEPRAASMPR